MTNSGQYFGSSPEEKFQRIKNNAKFIYEELGLNSSLLDTVPVLFHDEKLGPSFYASGGAPYISLSTGQINHATFLHESFHHLQDLLPEQEKQTLRELIAKNRPGGNEGFTNYPNGLPQVHHPLGSDWDLADYVDYSGIGEFTPDREMFLTPSSTEVRPLLPQPILDFLKRKFPSTKSMVIPGVPKMQPWDLGDEEEE